VLLERVDTAYERLRELVVRAIGDADARKQKHDEEGGQAE
jgi:hypothetical protein